MRNLIDNLIAVLGLIVLFAGCTLIMAILPWLDWFDCALFGGAIVVALVGVIGADNSFKSNQAPIRQMDFLAQPQHTGLIFRIEIPRFSLTIEARQLAPAMAY